MSRPYPSEGGPLASVQLPKLVDEPSWLLWHLNLEATLNAEGLINYVRRSIENPHPNSKYDTDATIKWRYSRRRAYSIILSTLGRPIVDHLVAQGFDFSAGDPYFLMNAASRATYIPHGLPGRPVQSVCPDVSNQGSLDAFLGRSSYVRLRYRSLAGEPDVGSDHMASSLLEAVSISHPQVYNKHIKRDRVVWDDVFRDLRYLADEELRNAPPAYTKLADGK